MAQRIRGRRLALMLVLAGAALSGISCRDDSVVAPTTGDAPEAALAATAALAFYQVSASRDNSCGLTTDSRAYCWGVGWLGNGTTTNSTAPVAVATTLRFRQLSTGSEHSCAVTTDYRVYCWGSNADGSLGDGTRTDRPKPVAVIGGRRFWQVDAGESHTCAISYPDNRAFCWGYGGEGELGNGTTQPAFWLAPVAVVGGLRFRRVSAGAGHFDDEGSGSHSCGVTTSDEAFCWGWNKVGQLGDGSNGPTKVSYSASPLRVAGGHRFREIDAGVDYTCAVTTGNRAYCWGNGRQGQIGDGKTYLRFSPSAVAGGHSFERVTAGQFHTCAETTLNRAYCWGSNNGALGDGTTTRRLTPVAVAGGLFFSQVSAGYGYSCGRTNTAVAYCWGTNSLGQLGDGTTTNRLRPTRVIGPR